MVSLFVVGKVGYEENINGNLPTNISVLIDCLCVFLKVKHLNTIPVAHRTGWYTNVGVPKVVALLLRAGADPNAKDNWSYTPLHEVKNSTDIQLVPDTHPRTLVCIIITFSFPNLRKFLSL